MYTFVLVIHVIVSILLMIVILLQDGKGGDVVSALGGGGSQSVFGGAGAAPFLTKATVVLTVIFAITSLSLAVLKTRERKSILESINPKVAVEETQVKKPQKTEPVAPESDNKVNSVQKNATVAKSDNSNGDKQVEQKVKEAKKEAAKGTEGNSDKKGNTVKKEKTDTKK